MYIQGLVIPVKKARLADYETWAKTIAQVFLDHGATRVVESVGDGLEYGEVTSFPRAVHLAEDEVAIFSWVEFPDKQTHDACMKTAFDDPRIGSPAYMPMEGKRMIFGGFSTLVEST